MLDIKINMLAESMNGQTQKVKIKFIIHSSLKPVLNWANVCLPYILRTVRRTIIRFLIELLVRRTWFGQSKLYFVLNRLVMRCKLRPELAADAQQTAWSKTKAKVKSCQYTLIIPHRVIQLTTMWWCAVVEDRQQGQSKRRPQQAYGNQDLFSARGLLFSTPTILTRTHI